MGIFFLFCREQVTNSTISTRIGGTPEEDDIGNDGRNIHRSSIPADRSGEKNRVNDKNADDLSTIMSQSQCSTCVSYQCKVCGENVHRNSGPTPSTAGAETCYSCSIYEGGSRSLLGSDISSCNSDCSSKISRGDDRRKTKSSKDNEKYDGNDDGGSLRSRRSVPIIRTDSESSLTESGSGEDSILGAVDSPQTGKLSRVYYHCVGNHCKVDFS